MIGNKFNGNFMMRPSQFRPGNFGNNFPGRDMAMNSGYNNGNSNYGGNNQGFPSNNYNNGNNQFLNNNNGFPGNFNNNANRNYGNNFPVMGQQNRSYYPAPLGNYAGGYNAPQQDNERPSYRSRSSNLGSYTRGLRDTRRSSRYGRREDSVLDGRYGRYNEEKETEDSYRDRKGSSLFRTRTSSRDYSDFDDFSFDDDFSEKKKSRLESRRYSDRDEDLRAPKKRKSSRFDDDFNFDDDDDEEDLRASKKRKSSRFDDDDFSFDDDDDEDDLRPSRNKRSPRFDDEDEDDNETLFSKKKKRR